MVSTFPQSIKSMPVGFQFTGSPTSGVSGQSDDVNTEKSNVIFDNIPKNGDLSGEVVWVILDDNGKIRIFKCLDNIYIFL